MIGNGLVQTLRIPVYLTREQLHLFRAMAKGRQLGITAYLQWVLSEHLDWNRPDPQPMAEAMTVHKAIAELVRWNDCCLERHLGQAKRPRTRDERQQADRELQQALDVGAVQ